MSEKISIALESGETLSSNIVSLFMIPDTNKKYIVTTENAVDPHGLTVLHVSELVDDTLNRVATDDEWSTIKTIMRAIISGNVGSYQYLPLVNEVKAGNQYSRDISVSSSASKQMMDSYEVGLKQLEEASTEKEEVVDEPISTGNSIFPEESVDANEDNSVVPGIVDVSDEKSVTEEIVEEQKKVENDDEEKEEEETKVDEEVVEKVETEENVSEATEEVVEENKNDDSVSEVVVSEQNAEVPHDESDNGVVEVVQDEIQQPVIQNEPVIENQETDVSNDVVNSDLGIQNVQQNNFNVSQGGYENQGFSNMSSEMVVSKNMNENQMDFNNGQLDGQVVMQNQEMMGTQPQDMMAMQNQQMMMPNGDMMQGVAMPAGPYDELVMEMQERFAECLRNALEKLSIKENELSAKENELRARENELFVRDNDLRNREAFLAQKERAINDQMKSMMNNFAMFQQTAMPAYSPMGQPQMQQPMMQQPMGQPQMQQPMMQQQPMGQPQMQQPMMQQPFMQNQQMMNNGMMGQPQMQQPTMIQVPSDENMK